MKWLFWLALRELRRRRGRSLLSLLALALSVGLVVATGSIGALMQASVARPHPLLGRPADLWVSSAYDVDYDLPADLAARAGAVPGVAQVQPVLRRPVRVQTDSEGIGPRTDSLVLLGANLAPYFAFHDLTLAAGTLPLPETPGLVALAPWAFIREVSLGQPVAVTTPSGDVALPVTGLIAVESLTAARQGLVLYAPLDTMADLFDLHAAATTLEVRLAPGASSRRVRADLEQALGPACVVSAAAQPGQGSQLWQRLVLGALIFVDGLTLLGSVGLVYAVLASAARARRRQIGLLRVAGAVRRQVLALLCIEAGLLGLAGAGVGVVVGLLFAALGGRLVLPDAAALPLPPVSAPWLLLAVTLGVLGSLGGALGPAMRAARQAPLAALRTMPLQTPQHASQRPSTRRAAWSRRLPSEAALAAANLARERGRALLTVAALALILGMALGNVGILSLLGEELAAAFGRSTGGDFLVLPGLTALSLRELAGQDTSDVPPLPAGLLAALDALTDRVWLMAGTTANVEALQVFPGQPTLLLDIEGYARMGGFRFQAGNWSSALQTFRRGPAVLLMPVVARRLNVGLGDTLRLDTLRGPVDFSVAGIGDSELTACVLSLADGATYLGANEVNAVEVQVRPGADVEAVRQALLDAVQTHGGTLLSLGQAVQQLRRIFDQARLSIGLLIGVTGLVAGLGVVNALAASVAERRREIGLLRAVGATRRQVGRLVLAEAAMLGALAAVAGTALGWAITLLFVVLARTHLGLVSSGASSLAAWWPLLAASLLGLILWPVLAMLGGLVPALQAVRLPVIRALYGAAAGR